MLAYACDPEGTGEHWLGWRWAEEAARSFEVHLFTPPKARGAIERHAERAGMRVSFVEVPTAVRALSERLGGETGWWRKLAWQKRATREVAAVHARERFAIVHQTTFHSFRVPFSAASLGIPAVWGPIAGGEHVPPGFEDWLGAAGASERRRRVINRLWLALPAVQRSLRAARAIFVSNRVTLGFLPARFHAKCTVVPPNALRDPVAVVERAPARAGSLALLSAGYCAPTRCLPLVLEAMARLADSRVTLTVAGEGPALAGWCAHAARLGLSSQVKFLGQVPHARLAELYASADALVFPALRDAGGSALLEAMALGMPVICFDWAGPAEMVDAASGVKIAVQDPQQTIADLAAALRRLRDEPAWRAELGRNAAERARARFTWEAKRELLESVYRGLLP